MVIAVGRDEIVIVFHRSYESCKTYANSP
jgi:hypothetical protein